MTNFRRMTMEQLLAHLEIEPRETTASTYLYIDTSGNLSVMEKWDRSSYPIDEGEPLGYAWMTETEETFKELERRTGISQLVLNRAANKNTLWARKSAGVWLSTVAAVEYAIERGHIRATAKYRRINTENQAASNTMEHREKRFSTA